MIGVPDPLTGESLVAFVVPKAGKELAPSELEGATSLVAGSLGSTLRPRMIYGVPGLPKTQSGKIGGMQ